jgi:hypothetical protein
MVEKRKICAPYYESNLGHPAHRQYFCGIMDKRVKPIN